MSDSGPLGPLVSYFSSKPYVVTTHLNRLTETVQIRGSHYMFLCRINKKLYLIITKYFLLSRALNNTYSKICFIIRTKLNTYYKTSKISAQTTTGKSGCELKHFSISQSKCAQNSLSTNIIQQMAIKTLKFLIHVRTVQRVISDI